MLMQHLVKISCVDSFSQISHNFQMSLTSQKIKFLLSLLVSLIKTALTIVSFLLTFIKNLEKKSNLHL
jgi:hypothetical protein